MIDGEEGRERQELGRAQQHEVGRAGLTKPDFLFVDVRVAVELSQALVQPQRQRLPILVHEQVSVLVN